MPRTPEPESRVSLEVTVPVHSIKLQRVIVVDFFFSSQGKIFFYYYFVVNNLNRVARYSAN